MKRKISIIALCVLLAVACSYLAYRGYRAVIDRLSDQMVAEMEPALELEAQGQYGEAAKIWRRLLVRFPGNPLAMIFLARVLAEDPSGDLDEALKLAEMAKAKLPKNGIPTDVLGWVHYKRKEYDSALALLEEAARLVKDAGKSPNPLILYHLAEARFALEDFDGARDVLNDARLALGDHSPLLKTRIMELSRTLERK